MLLKRFIQDKFKSVHDKIDLMENFWAIMAGMVGNVYYVHSSGSDSYSGLDKDHPLLTITAALAKVTHQNNDYIIILDYYQSTGETWPIAVNKQRVHIIGVSGPGCPWPWVQPPDDTAAFNFTGNNGYSEIAGLELGAGASHGCIEVTHGGIWGLNIHHNHFGTDTIGMTGLYGIYTPVGALMSSLIEHNKFGGGLTSDGINVPGNTAANSLRGCVIRKNFFRPDGIGINIQVAADFDEGGIFDNRFVMSSDATGKAITLVAGVVGGMIDGNVAGVTGQEAPTNNPYLATTACGPAWGVNYKGGTALLAAAAHA